VIAGAVKQFWTDILWGDIDVLLVDMPPGTGDVPLTVFQSLPLDGIVIVTSPQDLVSLIVKKAYNMAKMMDIPVLGVVENYSYMSCPDCGKIMYPFGQSKIDDIAKDLGVKVLSKLPMNPDYAALADAGKMDELDPVFIEDGVDQILNEIDQEKK
jgi:Mrp family chromosome partitioning ATPase